MNAQDLIEFRLSIETGRLNEMIANNLKKERLKEGGKERARGRKKERKQRQKDTQPIYRTNCAFCLHGDQGIDHCVGVHHVLSVCVFVYVCVCMCVCVHVCIFVCFL